MKVSRINHPVLGEMDYIDMRSPRAIENERIGTYEESLGPELNLMVDELTKLALGPGFLKPHPDDYEDISEMPKFKESDYDGWKLIRAREIAETINSIGGFQLMQIVHARVASRVPECSRYLEVCWDKIGNWRG